jgi:predicted ribosomally synthesized peptide with nif11-like leader
MTLQQLEAFLERAQGDPALQAPLASAPDAAAIAAIAHAAGFAVTPDDLIEAMGEQPAVLEGIERLSAGQDPPQGPLAAFLQQLEVDPDLQTALASATDPEAVAAIARLAGFQLSAEDLWEASNESPAALEPGSFDELAELVEAGAGDGSPLDREAVAALAGFLRQLEADFALQSAVARAHDAATVVTIARSAGFAVTEECLWGVSAESAAVLDPWPGPQEGQNEGAAAAAVPPEAP